ncbi:MAG: transcription antitermination factor NusB [Lachnospiraceae bacterium]|nr:transcription antitermination factor NusB [Lachnospiraceae bacterium]
MTRHEFREEVFKSVFQADFYQGEEQEEQLRLFLDEEEDPVDKSPVSEDDRAAVEEKSSKIISMIPELDRKIDEVAEGWKTKRMAKVDLTVLRLAVYEIEQEQLAPGIAINEAVEIAKKYGSDTSGSFVNGILARIVK